MKHILLIGAGGHCKSCIDVIEHIDGWCIAGVVDRKESGATDVLGYPIIGCDEDLPELRKRYEYAFVTVGQIATAKVKIKLFNELKNLGFKQPSFVSPLAYVSTHACIGVGTIVMHHALVNAAAHIGNNCIVNSKALVEHDAVVKDHCHIATGAVINGGVIVGEETFVGSLATTKQVIIIPSKSFIKAGSVVK